MTDDPVYYILLKFSHFLITLITFHNSTTDVCNNMLGLFSYFVFYA